MNETKLSTDCVTASSVNMFMLHIDENCWTHNKPIDTLSSYHLGLCLGWQSC